MLEGSGISPFSQRGLYEAFGFAVRLRGVRLNPDVLDSELFASAGEGFGEVAATIVSHDAFDGNTEAPKVGDGGDQERDGAFLLLVGEDLSTRYPRMVVDSDMDEFPACTLTAAIARPASGDAVAHAAETAELLNIEMDDLAWFLALVPWMWLLQLEAREHEGFHLGGGATKCRALPWSNPLFIVLGEPQIEVFPIGFTAIKMQRISNKRLPLVDIRSTAGLSPRLIPPPLPIVPCYCSPCFLPAGTGTANGLYWVGRG